MKKLALVITLFSFNFSWAQDTDEVFVLDQIERVIVMACDKPGSAPDQPPSPRQTKIITARQLQLPDLAGRMVPPAEKLEELTRMDMYSMYGNRFGIMQADDEVDKYIGMIAQSNKLKPDDMKRVFSSAGRTEEEGKQEIADGYRAKAVMQMKVGDGSYVPRSKVVSYFNEHPELQQPSYQIEYARVPFSSVKNQVAQKAELERYAQNGFGVLGVSWSDPFWVSKEEVAEEKQFIFDLTVDQVSQPYQAADCFELYRLKQVKEPSLEDRYDEIVQLIQQPMVAQKQQEFEQQELFDKAAIIDLGVLS